MTTTNYNSSNCQVMECPICISEITGNLNRVTTECGHEFHAKCLMSNIAYNGFGCPYCRSEMVDELVSKHAHEDEDDDEDDHEESDDLDEIQEEDNLRAFRFLFQRVTGEDLTDETDEEDEDIYEADIARGETPRPSINLIVKKLSEKGVTIETLIKALFLDHPEYNRENDDHEDYHKLNDDIYDKMRDIISDYNPEEEEEEQQEQHVEADQENKEPEDLNVVSNHPFETTNMYKKSISHLDNIIDFTNIYDYNFYFLEKSFVEVCKINTNTMFLEEEPNYDMPPFVEDEFITSIVEAVF